MIAAMRDPAVRMIGHLSARMIGARPPIQLDLDAVVAAAQETGNGPRGQRGPAAAGHVRRSSAARSLIACDVRADKRCAPRK